MVNSNSTNFSQNMAQSRDEIDLKELVSALWSGKLSIIIFTFLYYVDVTFHP